MNTNNAIGGSSNQNRSKSTAKTITPTSKLFYSAKKPDDKSHIKTRGVTVEDKDDYGEEDDYQLDYD